MRWTRRGILSSAIGVCTVSGCLSSSDNPERSEQPDRSLPMVPTGTWAQSGCNAQNTCASDVNIPDQGTLAWSGGSGLITPLVAGQTVYTVDDVLTALDAQTGEAKWKKDLSIEKSPNSATQPAAAGNHLLLASEGQLRSFNTADGSKRWERNMTGRPIQPITIATSKQLGFTFFQRPEQSGTPFELISFRISSGEIEWTAQLKTLHYPPAVFDDHVYVGGWAGPETQVLRCLGLDKGELIWEREIEEQTTPPIGTNKGVVIGEGADIRIYNHSDGVRLASVNIPHGEIHAIAIDDSMAFVLAEHGLSAVSVLDGGEQWSVSGESNYPQADGLAVGSETIIAPVFDESTFSPAIAAFDRTDGRLQWRYSITDSFSPTIGSPPVLADNAVFVITNTETGVTALGDLPPQSQESTTPS